MKKVLATAVLCLSLMSLASCGDSYGGKTYKIGLCNYVDDASLNQIVQNIKSTFASASNDEVRFVVEDDNANADESTMNQIISEFVSDSVDLMIGVATPVALAMQRTTSEMEKKTPVVFAAVSDPLGARLVASLDNPGANITGTSDFLDTNAVMNLIFAQNPSASKIGLLYDESQESSRTSIAAAKEFLDNKGVTYVERTGINTDNLSLAVDGFIADKVDAIFTPSDNTVMTAELAIYSKMRDAKIPHYAGADSFALNGAFCGYGIDYAELGKDTARMAIDILSNNKDVATYAVKRYDNGTATVNSDIASALDINIDELRTKFAPYCEDFKTIKTGREF